MELKDVEKAITDAGFYEYKVITKDDLIFSEDVFNQCKRNTCGMFGKNYACPPLNGTTEECKNRILKYDNLILLNKLIDISDREAMERSHKLFSEACNKVRKFVEPEGGTLFDAGACDVCSECAALTDEPCRFPDKVRYSVEGHRLDICSMSIKLKMTYNGGKQGVGYFALLAF